MINIRKALTLGGATAALVGASFLGGTAAMAAGPDYGGGAVAPGSGQSSMPVNIVGESVDPGEAVAAPAPKAPNGSPVQVESQQGLQVRDGKVTYPSAGYYHWSFQSEDGSYTGTVLVRVGID